MDFATVLQKLDSILADGTPWAVVGGLALSAHGAGRITHDVDIATVRTAQDQLVSSLETLGYRTLHRSEGYSNHAHPDAVFGRVDVVYVEGTTARDLLGEAGELEIVPGTVARVVRPEHLVAMKALAAKNDPGRRPQEIADIIALLRATGIQADRVRVYFERQGLLDDWERIRDSL